jgi:hypothetical protein
MGTAPDPGYDAGVLAGRIEQRLTEHDRHFATINGSMGRLADEMHGLTLAVQRLADSAAADRATVITTAAALKDAEEARRSITESRWSPMARLIAVIVCLAAVASVIVLILRK